MNRRCTEKENVTGLVLTGRTVADVPCCSPQGLCAYLSVAVQFFASVLLQPQHSPPPVT